VGNAQAGWYDDGAGRKRWWDGEKWTDDVQQPQADTGGGLAERSAISKLRPAPRLNRIQPLRGEVTLFSR
jgi:hypothetical protein